MADLRAYARLIGGPLAMGNGRAAGIDPYSGKVLWAPADTWRTTGTLKGLSESAAFLALSGERIRFPIPLRLGSFNGYAILPWQTLALMLDATRPPDAPLASVLVSIREVPQTTGSVGLVASVKDSGKGGRKPSQDKWRLFWIEVTRWAAKNDLEPPEERRPQLRTHMLKWAGTISPKALLSEASIDRALRDLFAPEALKT